jgi:outer membrane protein assembly factor BamB
MLIIFIGLPAYSQTERWVFRYNGPANSADVANSLVYGADGNIYVAGYSYGNGTNYDFVVISLNKDTGDTNWVYRYNGPGNGADVANSVVYGVDSNIYVAGYSTGSGTGTDFIVISLKKDTGDTNWLYRYNGPGNSGDGASSIAYGMDGNLYATGSSRGLSNSYSDITVISLSLTGSERWVYRYNGILDSVDAAEAIVYGVDNNLYIAGYSNAGFETGNFTVISIDTSGAERWVYADSIDGVAHSLVYGADGNVYAAGYVNGIGNFYDIEIVSLTALGSERWRYSYAGPPGSSGDDLDEIRSIVFSSDGNVYVAGVSDSTDWTNPTDAFTVISLTSSGSQRWIYRYYSGIFDWANSIVYGADNNLYAAGMCFQGTRAFGVISLTPAGGERWIYQYNSLDLDEALSIIFGADSNVYVAGYAGGDLLVVSLNPETGVKDNAPLIAIHCLNLSASTLQYKKCNFTLSLPKPMIVQISLYSVVGEKVQSWIVSESKGTSYHSMNLSVLSGGIYILKAETINKEYSDSKKLIYIK